MQNVLYPCSSHPFFLLFGVSSKRKKEKKIVFKTNIKQEQCSLYHSSNILSSQDPNVGDRSAMLSPF